MSSFSQLLVILLSAPLLCWWKKHGDSTFRMCQCSYICQTVTACDCFTLNFILIEPAVGCLKSKSLTKMKNNIKWCLMKFKLEKDNTALYGNC